MMTETPTGYGVNVTLSAYNEPDRIGRLASALSLAMAKAETEGVADVLASMLISMHDHKGALTVKWAMEVWETDSAVDPDLPLAFLCIEYGWSALGETIVVHAVDGSDDTVERTVRGWLPPRLTIV